MKSLIVIIASLSFLHSYSQSGGESCATATAIDQLPFYGKGNILEASNDYTEDCQGNLTETPDHVYKYSVGPSSLYLNIGFCSDTTDFLYRVSVYKGSCSGIPIFCEYGFCGFSNLSDAFNRTITTEILSANTTYYIVLDGIITSDFSGNYFINIDENRSQYPPDSTNLPLILINTEGQDIGKEEKITASMKIINNGSEEMNRPTDAANGYDGLIGIEIRGNDSAGFPQAPFGLETRDSFGENNNVSLLGMPEENDWILLSNYNDKVFFRNMLSTKLFREMGHYAPRTQLCEVVINDRYNGVYVFTEKIKRDKNRVNISTLNTDENVGDDLTGGYIFRLDPWFDLDNSWSSKYKNPHIPFGSVRYVYNYPDVLDITDQQKTYIQGSVSEFEDALWGANFRDPENGYRKYIDVPSFVDYFIVNEFARNNDGFKKSRNFFKDKDSIDPLIYAGPVWDFDWAYKDITETASFINGAGWQHSRSGNPDVTPPGWYIRMMQDSLFSKELTDRYFDLRSGILAEARLFNYIDSLAEVVEAAQQRHYDRWPTLGVSVGTQEFGTQPTTFADEIIKFKNWISERLVWLDANMPPIADPLPLGMKNSIQAKSWSIYPNPSSTHINIQTDKLLQRLNIHSLSGQLVHSYPNINASSIHINSDDLVGIYVVTIYMEDGQIFQTKLISH